jgi:hypothetical protein
MAKTIQRDDFPEVAGVVRMFIFSRLLIKPCPDSPNDTVDYTEFTQFNMNGYFPDRLMNLIVAAETRREFSSMYKHLKSKS